MTFSWLGVGECGWVGPGWLWVGVSRCDLCLVECGWVWVGVTSFWLSVGGCEWVWPFFGWVWMDVGKPGWVWLSARLITLLPQVKRGMCIIRSSPLEMFLGKGVLKICSKFTGENPCWSVISIKLLKQSHFNSSIVNEVNRTIINLFFLWRDFTCKKKYK